MMKCFDLLPFNMNLPAAQKTTAAVSQISHMYAIFLPSAFKTYRQMLLKFARLLTILNININQS